MPPQLYYLLASSHLSSSSGQGSRFSLVHSSNSCGRIDASQSLYREMHSPRIAQRETSNLATACSPTHARCSTFAPDTSLLAGGACASEQAVAKLLVSRCAI